MGLGVTALIGAFGETARLILQENVDRDTLREIFRRDTLRQNAALALFIISTAAGFLWAMYGRQARERFGNIGAAPRRTRCIESAWRYSSPSCCCCPG